MTETGSGSEALWRIGAETPEFGPDDLDGKGASINGGRWNSVGTRLVYSSRNIALACLETVVHLATPGLPMNRYLVRIDIPTAVWDARSIFTATQLNAQAVGWDAQPAGRTSIRFGDAWQRSGATLLLEVASAIVPDETNVLINPDHPDVVRIAATKVRRWLYDPRLL